MYRAIYDMTQQSQQELLWFVQKYLVTNDAKCYRHCQRPTKFSAIFQSSDSLVGAYVCSENYVSRVVYFSANPNAAWFQNFLKEQVGERLRQRDIRFATRHGWELGGNAEREISKFSDHGIRQYYWTFYPKNDEEKKTGTFLCSRKESGGCETRLFTKPLDEESVVLCKECRMKKKK